MKKAEEEAARWFVRMRAAAPDHPDRGRFESWLGAHPAHATEYATLVDMWQKLDSEGDALIDIMKKRRERQRQTRRAVLKRGTLGVLLIGAGGGCFYYAEQNRPQWQLARKTGVGGLERNTLRDGSSLVLSAGTDIAVVFTRAERRVELRTGEAIFDVMQDPDRPFAVDSGAARITVLGTRFAVNRLAEKVRVSVDHGRVQIDAGPFWQRRRAVLGDGQVTEITVREDGRAGTLQRVNRKAADSFAFERGMLMFEQADLAEIAETLSRYRSAPVRVRPGTPGAASPRIVAGIHVHDVESFIEMLPRLAPVTVSREDGVVWLRAQ